MIFYTTEIELAWPCQPSSKYNFIKNAPACLKFLQQADDKLKSHMTKNESALLWFMIIHGYG